MNLFKLFKIWKFQMDNSNEFIQILKICKFRAFKMDNSNEFIQISKICKLNKFVQIFKIREKKTIRKRSKMKWNEIIHKLTERAGK